MDWFMASLVTPLTCGVVEMEAVAVVVADGSCLRLRLLQPFVSSSIDCGCGLVKQTLTFLIQLFLFKNT